MKDQSLSWKEVLKHVRCFLTIQEYAIIKMSDVNVIRSFSLQETHQLRDRRWKDCADQCHFALSRVQLGIPGTQMAA